MLLAAVVLLPPAIGRLFGPLGLAELSLAAYAGARVRERGLRLARAWPSARDLAAGAAVLVAIDAVTTAWLAAAGT